MYVEVCGKQRGEQGSSCLWAQTLSLVVLTVSTAKLPIVCVIRAMVTMTQKHSSTL